MTTTPDTSSRPSSVWQITDAAPSRRKRPALAVGAVIASLVLLTIGISLGRASLEPRAATDAAVQRADKPAPRTPSILRTEAGAVTAATAMLQQLMSREYIKDAAVRNKTILAIALPSDRHRLADEVTDPTGPGAPNFIAAAVAEPEHSAWRLTPLGYRVDAFTADHAVVEIWTVQVVAGVGTADVPAAALWSTVRLPLVWAEQAWKLEMRAATVAHGPTPGVGPGVPSSDLDVVAAASRFTSYRHVAR